ncbi:MAG: PQQ-binding-like beta-propeller repeat protein [Spirochaetaceae bacterium]|nr:PQQ-binding-like beta-propeller repeat protein [Spirochaetaceae bacterium]
MKKKNVKHPALREGRKVHLVLWAAAVCGAVVFILIFLGCSIKRSSDWVVFRGEGGQGYSSEKIYPPIGIKWQFKLQEGRARERHFSPPVVYQNTLYFGSSDSNFYALDIRTGFMRWVYETRAPVNSVPFVDNEKVYFGSTDGYIYAVYHKTGDTAWEYFTGYPVNSTIIGYNDTIVFTTDTGATHFFSKDGEELNAIPNYVWQNNSFQINNDVVYFMPGPPEDPYSLAAYSIPENRYIWLLPTGNDGLIWYSFPAVSKNLLHYASCGIAGTDFIYVYSALNKKTGHVVWKEFEYSSLFELGDYDPFALFWENINLLDYMAPAIWKNYVIYAPGNNSVKAFNSSSGKKVWEKWFDFPVSSAPTVSDSRVYLGTRKSPYGDIPPYLVCLDAASGKVLWKIETEGDILGSPVIAGKWIIFGTDENYVYVLEKLF